MSRETAMQALATEAERAICRAPVQWHIPSDLQQMPWRLRERAPEPDRGPVRPPGYRERPQGTRCGETLDLGAFERKVHDAVAP